MPSIIGLVKSSACDLFLFNQYPLMLLSFDHWPMEDQQGHCLPVSLFWWHSLDPVVGCLQHFCICGWTGLPLLLFLSCYFYIFLLLHLWCLGLLLSPSRASASLVCVVPISGCLYFSVIMHHLASISLSHGIILLFGVLLLFSPLPFPFCFAVHLGPIHPPYALLYSIAF